MAHVQPGVQALMLLPCFSPSVLNDLASAGITSLLQALLDESTAINCSLARAGLFLTLGLNENPRLDCCCQSWLDLVNLVPPTVMP